MSDTTADDRLDLREHIRNIPDFPKPGILFRDITPMLAAPDAFRAAVRRLAAHYRESGVQKVCAAEARGFLFAAPLALELRAGFVPVRKPGKLPFNKHSFSYELEYGQDSLEMHIDALSAGDRVLLVDDLLATGGTMQACLRMVEKTGAKIVGCAFVIELEGLKGRERLAPYETFSLVRYEGA